MNEKDNGASRRATDDKRSLNNHRSYANLVDRQSTPTLKSVRAPITRENRLGTTPQMNSSPFIASKPTMKYETAETRPIISSVKNAGGEESSENQNAAHRAAFANRPATNNAVGSSIMGASSISHSKVSTASTEQRMTYAERAMQYRIKQTPYATSYCPSAYGKSWKYETAGSFNEALARYKANPVRFADSAKSAMGIGGRRAAGAAQDALVGANDNLGNSTASASIAAGVGAVTAFTVAQKASPALFNGIVKTGKGAYDVATTVGALHFTIARTAQFARSSFVPLPSTLARNVFMRNAYTSGLTSANTSRAFIGAVTTIQAKALSTRTAVVKSKNTVKNAAQAMAGAATKTFVFTKRVVNGQISFVTISHATLQRLHSTRTTLDILAKRGIKGAPHLMGRGANIAGRGVINGTVKSASWVYHRGFHHVGNAALGIGGALAASDDIMVSGVGHAITLGTYGVKATGTGTRLAYGAGKTTVKGGTRVVKGGAKTIRGIKRGVSFAKANGWENAWKVAWKKGKKTAGNAVVSAGNSIVSAILNGFKTVGRKVVLPLLLIAALVAATSSIFTAPIAAIGSIFSNSFDIDNGNGVFAEQDVRSYISNESSGIPAMRTKYMSDLLRLMNSNVKTNGGRYNFVRFKTNESDDILMSSSSGLSVAGISDVFYTEEELENIIQPIFNAVILKDYELELTSTEAKAVLQEIFNKLFRIDQMATKEYCGQSHFDGKGAINYGSDGRIYALDDCPNKVPLLMPLYCGGHDALTITLSMDGLYELLYSYFEQPIDSLAGIPNRSKEQEERFQALKDYYEICQEYIGQVSNLYGGGLTREDLSGVNWVNGTRTGNQAVIDVALTQVGNVGGKPYWSWYGFSSRVEWCACFVSWSMNQTGHSEIRYSSCSRGISYFQNAGRFAAGDYTDLVAGDVIFFDWQGDGKPDHTGLVIGTDGEYVYTVEGNSGDTCRTKKYPLSTSVIFGYGLMNY